MLGFRSNKGCPGTHPWPTKSKTLPTRRYGPLYRLISRSCGGLWLSAEAFYDIFADLKPFLVFSSNLNNFN